MYCKAIQALQISPGKPIYATFFDRHFSQCIKMHAAKRLHGHSLVINKDETDSRRVTLSDGLCLES